MLDWISSWWTTQEELPGPARNAPNDGQDIRLILEKRPPSVLVVTEDDVKRVLSSLRKVERREIVLADRPPGNVLEELRALFESDRAKYEY